MCWAGTALIYGEIERQDRMKKSFEASIAGLSEEEKATAREKRRLELREEAMHRELCSAIRSIN